MTAAPRPWARELLRIWFHDLDSSDWYGGGATVDELLREKFGHFLAGLGQRSAQEFLGNRRTAQAAILLFDQVPRNIHRGKARGFTYDPLARAIVLGVISRGWVEHFHRREKQFLLMPLMHSERIADQRLSLALFARHAPAALPFARSHWRMIARFGRFPHRNDVLGRSSTITERGAIESGYSW